VSIAGLENISNWASANGIGQLYSNKNQTAAREFRRGGDWHNGTGAGILSLDLTSSPLGPVTVPTTGFRVAR